MCLCYSVYWFQDPCDGSMISDCGWMWIVVPTQQYVDNSVIAGNGSRSQVNSCLCYIFGGILFYIL